MNRTQRVNRLISSFMDYHNQGYSIQEIAEKLSISYVTVYHYLDEIAKNNDTTREELLQKVHQTERSDKGQSRKEISINSEEIVLNLKNLVTEVDCLINKISEALKED